MIVSGVARRLLGVNCRGCGLTRTLSSAATFTSVREQDGIRTITLDHPKTRNALSIGMMETLIEDITREKDDPALRVIVLTHNGSVFSSGHNLRELSAAAGERQHREVFTLASRLMCAVLDSPVPVLARVDGVAAAAGCQLVAQCDFALCTHNSSFSTPGASFGIFCSTPGVAIGRSVTKSCAMHMLLTGLPLTSAEAQAAGLVWRVCPDLAVLDQELHKACLAIQSKSRAVIQEGRRFFYHQMQLDVRKAYSLGEDIMTRSCSTPDGKEGIDSFINKRKPSWKS